MALRVGASRCLLGDEVRYDGGHRRSSWVVELGAQFELVPLCPEVEIGLGVPRPPIQLVRIGETIRVRGVEDPAVDVTDALEGLPDGLPPLSGFILKARSPSCGIRGVPVHGEGGDVVGRDAGAFAREVMERNPGLPVIDEEALVDPVAREDFVARVRGYGSTGA